MLGTMNNLYLEDVNLNSSIRSCDPVDTFKRIQPFFDKIGITRIANITGLDKIGIPVALCVRPNAKHLSVSQGKGVTWEIARTSAAMEAIESFHAENPAPPLLNGSYCTLKSSDAVIDPLFFSRGFFECNVRNLKLDWVLAHNIKNQQSAYIPYESICLDSSKLRKYSGIFNPSSNGLASGNTKQEAIIHGLYEIIEREALAKWYRLSREFQNATCVSLSAIKSNVNQSIINQFIQSNLHVKIWNITSSYDVPAYLCVIQDADKVRGLPDFFGSGAFFVDDIALTRALVEAAQSRLTYITGVREEIFPNYYQQKKINIFDAVELNQGGFSDGEDSICNYTLNQIHDDLMDRTKDATIVMVDHTKPEFGLPVVHLFLLPSQSEYAHE